MTRNIERTLDGLLAETITTPTGCMEWQRCFNTDGYPRVAWEGYGANGKVHRIVYHLSNPEDLMDGLVVRHECDNVACINPEHLSLGTPADNMLDRDTRGRNYYASLDEDKVRAIRNLLNQGTFKNIQIASMFGVHPVTISSIKRGLSYKWVSP